MPTTEQFYLIPFTAPLIYRVGQEIYMAGNCLLTTCFVLPENNWLFSDNQEWITWFLANSCPHLRKKMSEPGAPEFCQKILFRNHPILLDQNPSEFAVNSPARSASWQCGCDNSSILCMAASFYTVPSFWNKTDLQLYFTVHNTWKATSVSPVLRRLPIVLRSLAIIAWSIFLKLVPQGPVNGMRTTATFRVKSFQL